MRSSSSEENRPLKSSNGWYTLINPENNITQGDIITNCPIFLPKYPQTNFQDFDFSNIKEDDFKVQYSIANVIILTQACDLEIREGQTTPIFPQY